MSDWIYYRSMSCPRCLYNLAGLDESAACPECGATSELRRTLAKRSGRWVIPAIFVVVDAMMLAAALIIGGGLRIGWGVALDVATVCGVNAIPLAACWAVLALGAKPRNCAEAMCVAAPPGVCVLAAGVVQYVIASGSSDGSFEYSLVFSPIITLPAGLVASAFTWLALREWRASQR